MEAGFAGDACMDHIYRHRWNRSLAHWIVT
jgi:hypothetical protein